MKFPRQRFIPPASTKIADKQSDAVAYLYTNGAGKPCARVFFGKQTKPVLACYFGNEAARERAVRSAFENRRTYQEQTNKRRAERVAWEPTYKVGNIFRTCWGYEQTNVEYFEIVEIKGKYAILRELCQERVDDGWLRGRCVPLPGEYAKPRFDGDDQGQPIRRLLQQHGIKIDEVRTAWLVKPEMVGGVPVIQPTGWTAYH